MKQDELGLLCRNPRLLLAPNLDGYHAYNPDTESLHRLNASAVLILELFEDERTTQQVCLDMETVLVPNGGAPSKLWIEYAISEGFLIEVSTSTGSSYQFSISEAIDRTEKLRDRGQILAAYVCCYKASELTPKDPEVWKSLGELAHIRGQREDARQAYENCLALCPDDAEIEHILLALRDGSQPCRASDECIRQLYSRFAEFYEENMYDDLDYRAPSLLAAAIHNTICEKDSLDVLDMGCGTGLIAKYLRPISRHLTGIDLSPEMIDRARETKLYDSLENSEITNWLAQNSHLIFDLIVACDTLIYFGSLEQVIAPVTQHLSASGILAFTLENGRGNKPFFLTDSGRYTHTSDHVFSVARKAQLVVHQISTEVLRWEYGEPVEGLVVILSRS
jgi:predicted TPR repeat methyltransferase